MLRLHVADPGENHETSRPPSSLTIADYLRQRPVWEPALEDTFLFLDAPGGEHFDALNPFGVLDFVVPQLREAADRISVGQFALLRTAGDWTPAFFVLEPDGGTTFLSMIASPPSPLDRFFPLARSPFFDGSSMDQRGALYAYVTDHREELRLLPPTFGADERAVQQLPIPTSALLRGLRDDVRAASELNRYLSEKNAQPSPTAG